MNFGKIHEVAVRNYVSLKSCNLFSLPPHFLTFMFRISSRSHRPRHVSLRRSTPVLQCGFARSTHPTYENSSSDSSSSSSGYSNYAPSNFFGTGTGAAPAGAYMRSTSIFSNLKFGDFNPVSFLKNVMQGDSEQVGLKLDVKPSFFIISIVAAVVISTVMTLVFATKGVTKGYVLRDLEMKSQGLVRQNEVINMQLAQAQSLHSVVTNDILLHMRPAQNVVYMSGSNTIASR